MVLIAGSFQCLKYHLVSTRLFVVHDEVNENIYEILFSAAYATNGFIHLRTFLQD